MAQQVQLWSSTLIQRQEGGGGGQICDGYCGYCTKRTGPPETIWGRTQRGTTPRPGALGMLTSFFSSALYSNLDATHTNSARLMTIRPAFQAANNQHQVLYLTSRPYCSQ